GSSAPSATKNSYAKSHGVFPRVAFDGRLSEVKCEWIAGSLLSPASAPSKVSNALPDSKSSNPIVPEVSLTEYLIALQFNVREIGGGFQKSERACQCGWTIVQACPLIR